MQALAAVGRPVNEHLNLVNIGIVCDVLHIRARPVKAVHSGQLLVLVRDVCVGLVVVCSNE